jgi:hypothetical protein
MLVLEPGGVYWCRNLLGGPNLAHFTSRSDARIQPTLQFGQTKVMPVLRFSARPQENYFAPQVRIHQIYPGTFVRGDEIQGLRYEPL